MNKAWLGLQGWAGLTILPVEVLKETPKRFKVKILEGGYRFQAGEIRYVPKYALLHQEAGLNRRHEDFQSSHP